ncbi:MAG TPA: S9 family peptidase [Roseiflexaceae bacterium]|nr:S9 family peptidase [Roseiflexaceae bacterium]
MSGQLRPPTAPVRPHSITAHGETRTDPYFWLRDRNDPDVIAYLNAENAYTEQALAHTRDLQERLYREMRGRIKERDENVPEQRDGYFYYTRTEEGQQYAIHCRRHGSMDAPEEILLDENALAEGQPFFRVGNFRVSPDHRLLAYATDTSGDEIYTLVVKDLQTGDLLPERIGGTGYGLEWANDSRTLYYVVLDPAHRPHKVFRHTLSSDPAGDVEVYHEPDELFYMELSKTRSRAYLLISLSSFSTSEVRYASADDPQAAFAPVLPRQQERLYSVDHHGDRFLILTNDQAQNFRLLEAPADSPGPAHWRELVPHRADVLLDEIDVFQDYLVLYERAGGLKQISILRLDGTPLRRVAFPEPVYTYSYGSNPMFDSHTLRFSYSSLATPPSVIDYDMAEGVWTVRKQTEIPSGHDPERYQTERIVATAPDGTQVPISLISLKGTPRDGSAPLLLYAYGSYGASMDPGFDSKRLSLIDRGVTYAIAHIRGGSELGRAWYDNGKLLHKRNTFTDFIACAEHLVAQGYTAPDRLAITGRSAGGLLMGAVVNMRPDLFKAVVADVPFVDVINTMSDPTIPLTVPEYEQWGNPADKTFYDYMKSYSPYDNVEAKDYPHMLVSGGLNDPRVQYWEPAKWVARLRSTKTDQNLLLLKMQMSAGHSGASGRFDYLKEYALEYAFVLDCLGIRD